MAEDGHAEQGSIDRPYRLAIVGGGPSGNSVVVRALRLGVINELCAGNRNDAGVCILDKSGKERYGGGRLQDYIINSNTYAAKFVTNVLSEKLEVDPPERIIGTTLVNLENSSSKYAVEAYGNSNLPLSTAGAFLRDVGDTVAETLSMYPSSCRCSTDVNVVGIQRVVDTKAVKAAVVSSQSSAENPLNAQIISKVNNIGLGVGVGQPEVSNTLWRVDLTNSNLGQRNESIYAHKVMLSTGGRQDRPRLSNASHQAKVIMSDHVCTAAGAAELRERLMTPGNGVCGKPGRIVIVGGSHSAFSAAWICLHKVHQAAASDGNTSSTPAVKDKDIGKESNNNSLGPLFLGNGSVVMTHRSSIKVFYGTKKDADIDNYTDIGQINRVTGQIHPFGGIRGDAKELFRSVRSNRETRIRMISLARACGGGTNSTLVNKLYDDAAVIIWACGYSTNQLSYIKDIDGSNINLRLFRGQVEVDEKAFIMSENMLNTVDIAAATTTQQPTPPSSSKLCVDTSPITVANNVSSSLSSSNGVLVPPSPLQSPMRSTNTNNGGSPLRLSSPMRSTRRPSVDEAALSTPVPVTKALSASVDSAVEPNSSAVVAPSTPAAVAPVVVPVTPATVGNGSKSSSTTNGTNTASKNNNNNNNNNSSNSSNTTVSAGPYRIPGLLGSGLGYGFKATFENGEPDGSSGRADGVAVYLKRGATLVLAAVLGSRVFGEGAKSWEQRASLINNARRSMFQSIQQAATAASTVSTTGDKSAGGPTVTTPVAGSAAANSFRSPSTPSVRNRSSGDNNSNNNNGSFSPMNNSSSNNRAQSTGRTSGRSAQQHAQTPAGSAAANGIAGDSGCTMDAIHTLSQSMESVKQDIVAMLDHSNASLVSARSPISRPQPQAQSHRVVASTITRPATAFINISVGSSVDDLEKQMFEPVVPILTTTTTASGDNNSNKQSSMSSQKQQQQPPRSQPKPSAATTVTSTAAPSPTRRRGSMSSVTSTTSAAASIAPSFNGKQTVRSSSNNNTVPGKPAGASNPLQQQQQTANSSLNATANVKAIDEIVERLTRPKRSHSITTPEAANAAASTSSTKQQQPQPPVPAVRPSAPASLTAGTQTSSTPSSAPAPNSARGASSHGSSVSNGHNSASKSVIQRPGTIQRTNSSSSISSAANNSSTGVKHLNASGPVNMNRSSSTSRGSSGNNNSNSNQAAGVRASSGAGIRSALAHQHSQPKVGDKQLRSSSGGVSAKAPIPASPRDNVSSSGKKQVPTISRPTSATSPVKLSPSNPFKPADKKNMSTSGTNSATNVLLSSSLPVPASNNLFQLPSINLSSSPQVHLSLPSDPNTTSCLSASSTSSSSSSSVGGGFDGRSSQQYPSLFNNGKYSSPPPQQQSPTHGQQPLTAKYALDQNTMQYLYRTNNNQNHSHNSNASNQPSSSGMKNVLVVSPVKMSNRPQENSHNNAANDDSSSTCGGGGGGRLFVQRDHYHSPKKSPNNNATSMSSSHSGKFLQFPKIGFTATL
jgi:hypothetical protein